MSEPGPEFDPEILFRDARSQFDQVAGMQRAMAELRGRAESQDGRVRAVYAQDQGLAEVELDPRAMRMSAADLGRLIVEVSGAAKRDLERQMKELMDETFAQQDITPDDLKDMFDEPSGLTETLGSMGRIFEGATKEVEGMLDQIRRVMGTAGAGSPGGAPGSGVPGPGTPGAPGPATPGPGAPGSGVPGPGNVPMAPPMPPVPPPPPPAPPTPAPAPPVPGPGGGPAPGQPWPWGGNAPTQGGDPWPWGGKPPETDDPSSGRGDRRD
ncbi:YbaB/EbfC family nucleoid-associated protein [Actinomadura sp. SCN-SB]|uniref:YbaB/EbfC family nucleoid-associated protein n=1 Tax=Actinomadura sp. SCN-SB TaxID=3373092 RepID=UPI0037537456